MNCLMHKPILGSTEFVQSPTLVPYAHSWAGADYPVNRKARHEPSLHGHYILNGRKLLNKSPFNKYANKIGQGYDKKKLNLDMITKLEKKEKNRDRVSLILLTGMGQGSLLYTLKDVQKGKSPPSGGHMQREEKQKKGRLLLCWNIRSHGKNGHRRGCRRVREIIKRSLESLYFILTAM